jgi:hypothetical protein
MKTLTELSGSLIRVAAAAIADARRSLPSEEEPAARPVAEAAPQAPEGSAVGAPDQAVAEPRDDAPPAPRDAQGESESDAVKAALDQAVANAAGVTGDRLAMLRAAVQAAGQRSEDVRLVRVFGLEEPLSGAQVIGQHQYVVDFFPRDMKQVVSAPKGERGRGGGGGRRGGGGAGAGGRGAKASATGGFSMDSLRDDRKNERGGRGRAGGGRRPGGGGAAGRGGSGGPAGGDPKK